MQASHSAHLAKYVIAPPLVIFRLELAISGMEGNFQGQSMGGYLSAMPPRTCNGADQPGATDATLQAIADEIQPYLCELCESVLVARTTELLEAAAVLLPFILTTFTKPAPLPVDEEGVLEPPTADKGER